MSVAEIAVETLSASDLIERHPRATSRTGYLRIRRKFELMVRFYAPTKALFEKAWKLPDVEKVK